MVTSRRNANLPHRAFQVAWPAGLALIFLAIMILFYPFRQQFEYSRDEGVNLMKAMMVAKGYSLYEEIRSDQPPFFTYWLAGAFELAGFKVNVARLVVLILSTLLVWMSVEFLRQAWGILHALAGFILLLLLPKYLELSVSVMVVLPSLAFATASLAALALWHRQRKAAWLAVSAIALGVSILTKAFTGFLVPIFVLGITIPPTARLVVVQLSDGKYWLADLWDLRLDRNKNVVLGDAMAFDDVGAAFSAGVLLVQASADSSHSIFTPSIKYWTDVDAALTNGGRLIWPNTA